MMAGRGPPAAVGVWGLGFRVWGLGFGVWGLGFGITYDWFASVGSSSSSKVGEHYKLRGGVQ